MPRIDVVRAWKDPSYRAGLNAQEIARIPSHPAGLVDLSDEELKTASGLGGIPQTDAAGPMGAGAPIREYSPLFVPCSNSASEIARATRSNNCPGVSTIFPSPSRRKYRASRTRIALGEIIR